MVKNHIISGRYTNDGTSLVPLNDLQKKYIFEFRNDKRFEYKTVEQCVLCGGTEFILIAEKDRYGIPVDTAVCDRCGLIFSLTQMTDESAKIFYSEYYRKIYEGVEVPPIQYYKSYLGKRGIPRFLNHFSTVVEIGTGGGWNLLKYKLKNIKHYGFDYDENYIAFGKNKFGLNLFNGGVKKAKELGVKADYVILCHVLEHTMNPVEFLSEIQDIMQDNAILDVTVPSASLLLMGGAGTGYDLLGTLQNAHIYLFDRFVLQYIALKSGYDFYITLGETIVLKKNKNSSTRLLKIENILKKNPRGKKVIKYLKLCEMLVPFKNKIIPSKLKSGLHYIEYFYRPYELLKSYFLFRKGLIRNG